MKRRLGTRAIAIFLLLAVLVPPSAASSGGSRWRASATSERGVVATDHPLAAQVAIDILNDGGNAMDAAVAAVFAIGVVRFEMCGVGGGGFLVYRSEDGVTATLDFRETAPRENYVFTKGIYGGTNFTTFGTGHQVVGVPGLVAGMEAAATRFGSKPFGELVEPAAQLADAGFPVPPTTAFHMSQLGNRMRYFPESSRVYLKPDGTPYQAGEKIKLPDYAAVLNAIATGGAKVFYEGWIAEKLIEEMQRPSLYSDDASAMTLEDLANYEPVWRAPLETTYRNHRITAMPPPTSGGTATIEMLNILEGFDLAGMGHLSADQIHVLAEAQKIAWADRNRYVGDPDFADAELLSIQQELTSKDYAAQRRGEIDMKNPRAKEYEAGNFGDSSTEVQSDQQASHTSHVSVIDGEGNAVSVTCSIEQPFGSAVVAPGTGFLLNNELTDFSDPGSGSANEPEAGKRPRSSMNPIIVVYRGKPVLVVGAAGGAKIIMGVTQMISNVVDFGLDLPHAIDAARIDARAFGSGLNLENGEGRVESDVIAELRDRGHDAREAGEYAQDPIVNAVGTDRATRMNHAVTDPRGHADDWGSAGQR